MNTSTENDPVITGFPQYYMLTFPQRETHPVQTYSWMATPVRWNTKEEEERVIIFRVKDKKAKELFITGMKALVEGHKRFIKVQRVKDIFCKACGALYQYTDKVGVKTCTECGGTDFKS